MNAKIFCIASPKGGSGKTILTASISSFLSALGKKCLMVDCDAATHGLTLLYLVEVSKNLNNSKNGFFEGSSSTESHELLQASVISVENNVDFLPATYNFSPGFDPEESFEEDSLLNLINLVKTKYDFILLDAQAGSDNFSRLAMKKTISDEVIIVSEYDPLSAAGIERLKQVVGDDIDYTRTWILLNKMLPEFVDKFSEFLSIANYLPPIPWNADVVRAYAKRKLALDLEKGNAFTLSIMGAVSTLLGDQFKSEIADWADERSYALKEPLKVQYADAEKELKYLLESQNKLELKEKKRKLIGIYGVMVPVFLTPFFLYSILTSIGSFGSLDDSFLFSKIKMIFGNFTFTAAVILVLVVTFPVVYSKLMKLFQTKKTTESARYERRIQVLEEQLKQLESLDSADFETIIKKNMLNRI